MDGHKEVRALARRSKVIALFPLPTSSQRMKVAVTGSNGSVGRYVVVAALKAGHSVVGIDCSQVEPELDDTMKSAYDFRVADLREYNAALEALRGSEAVIHLAAVPHPGDYVVDSHNT